MATQTTKLRLGLGDSGGLGLAEMTREEAQRRKAEKVEEAPRRMRDYAQLIPERGVALDLDRFPYQEAWYSEEVARALEVVWMKGAQIGMSGYAWRWAVQRSDLFGDRIIYFFPTDDDVADFGDQRIEPSIGDSPHLLRRIPASHVKHKHLKQIGAGFLSLRGTQSASAVQSVDADGLVFDEVEYLHQPHLAQAQRRVAGAEAAGRVPRKRWLGYPRLPGGVLHVKYEQSDKRVWHVTCPECGKEQPLEWKHNVRWRSYEGGEVRRWGKDEFEQAADVFEAWRCCRHCEANLEEEDGQEEWGPIRSGRWVRTQPESKLIGFHASRLIVPFTNVAELVENSRKTRPGDQEAFWNNDLGLPFSPSEASLDEDTIRAAMSFGVQIMQSYRARSPIVGGLDVASERDLTVAISELQKDGTATGIYVGEPENFDDVLDLMEWFRIRTLVVDSMPDRRMARGLASRYPGRVHLAEYDHRNEADAWVFNAKKNMVRINRTEGIDAMMDRVRQETYRPPSNAPWKYVSQLMAPKRQTVTTVGLDGLEKQKRVYVSTGPDGDDWAHAEVYNLVAKYMYLLRLQVEGEAEAQRGRTVSDEQLGIGRRRGIDDYRPGFGRRG